MSYDNRRPYSSNRFSKEIEEIHERREAEAAKKKRQQSAGKRTATGRKTTSGRKTGTARTRRPSRSYSGTAGTRTAAAGTGRTYSSARRQGYTPGRTGTVRRTPSYGKRKRKRDTGRRIRILGAAVVLLLFFVIGIMIHRKYMAHLAVVKKEELRKETLKEAEILAQGYDYEAAIQKAMGIDNYAENQEAREAVAGWKDEMNELVEFTVEDVTHIFYHTLVREPELAFECAPSIAEGFKKWMTTIEEFNRITETMYREGYVLCSLYDFFDEIYDVDGVPHFSPKSVYLPEGKKPFILSLDDLSYYHTYTGHGMATKLVLDDEGKVTCQYELEDGSVETGSFDCVPLIDDFMEDHPDGAYHGARGTIALTGYNGIFGYRTDESYETRTDLDADKVEWLDDHPDFDRRVEIDGAYKVAEALKEEGWTFASHTWGHIRVGNAPLDKIRIDTEKWLKNVKPIIGDTECIIFAHGQDLSPTEDYDTENNEKYRYLADQGFHIFLNVDSHQKTMKVYNLYVHGGRRNLDGYRLWMDAHGVSDWTSDLFRAADILDSRRKDMPDQAD